MADGDGGDTPATKRQKVSQGEGLGRAVLDKPAESACTRLPHHACTFASLSHTCLGRTQPCREPMPFL